MRGMAPSFARSAAHRLTTRQVLCVGRQQDVAQLCDVDRLPPHARQRHDRTVAPEALPVRGDAGALSLCSLRPTHMHCNVQISSKLSESVLKPLTWPELVSAVRRSRKDLVPSTSPSTRLFVFALCSLAPPAAGQAVCFDWTIYDVTRHFSPEREYPDGNFLHVRHSRR